MKDLLLYDLFDELRRQNFAAPISTEDYYALFTFLQTGYPIRHFDDLRFVLETIWTKTPADQKKLRAALDKRLADLQGLVAQFEAKAIDDTSTPAAATETVTETEKPKVNEPIKPVREQTNDEQEQQATAPATQQPTEGYGFSLAQPGADGRPQFGLDKRQDEAPAETATPFIFTSDYFPVQDRHLRQAWRSLKSKAERESSADLDITATIVKTAKNGYFSDFAYEKRTFNQLRLFVFIDTAKSMVAVEAFGKQLCETASESHIHSNVDADREIRSQVPGSKAGKVKPWFFYNVPELIDGDYYLWNDSYTERCALAKLFRDKTKRNIVVLIYSDAGSLVNDYDPERQEKLRSFLYNIGQRTAYVSWLNPAPRHRWSGTNADAVRDIVPMFEATRENVENSIAALKGKVQPA